MSASKEHIFCNICNVYIPDMFIEEHNLSARHQSYLKIVEKLLYRLREVSTYEQVLDKKDKDPNVYFCSSCVVIVDRKDRYMHENSISHSDSQNIDQLVDNFFEICLNNDRHKEQNDKCLNTNKRKVEEVSTDNLLEIQKLENPHIDTSYDEIKFVSKHFTKTENVDNNDISICKKDKAIGDCMKINDNLTSNLLDKVDKYEQSVSGPSNRDIPTQHGTQDNFNDIENFKRFIEVITKTYNLEKTITLLGDLNLEIVTFEGSCVKVSEDNFHGFKRLGTGHIQCLLCQEIVRHKNKEEHVYSKWHMEKVCVAVRNKNCIREFETWNHCIICNTLIENADMHILCNDVHGILLQKALISDREEFFNSSTGKFESIPNNLKKPKNLELEEKFDFSDNQNVDLLLNVKSYSNLSKHEVNKPITEFNNVKDSDENLFALENRFNADVTIKPENNIYCFLCKIILLPNQVSAHYNSKKHKANDRNNNATDYYLMELVNDHEVHCIICFITIENNTDKVQNHLSSVDHMKEYYSILMKNDIREIKNPLRFYCQLCQLIIRKPNEILHINRTTHKEKMNSKNISRIERVYNPRITNIIQFYNCKYCDIIFPNEESTILSHNEEAKHLKNIKIFSKNAIRNPSQDISSSQSEDKIQVFECHYHLLFKMTHLYCSICDLTVPLNETDMNIHINKDTHKQNYKRFIKHNHLKRISFLSYFCKLCSMCIEPKFEILHCKSKRHLTKLDLHTLDAKRSNASSKIPIPENTSLKRSKDLQSYLLQEIYNSEGLKCKVCETEFPNNEDAIYMHLKSPDHYMKYNFLLTENCIVVSGNDYYRCNRCYKMLPKGTEFSHIDDNSHKANNWNIETDFKIMNQD